MNIISNNIESNTSRLNYMKVIIYESVSLLFGLYAWLKLNPYFLWETFCYGKYSRFMGTFQTVNIVGLLALLFALLCVLVNKRIAFKKVFFSIAVIILGYSIIHISGRDKVLYRAWINYFIIAAFVLLDTHIVISSLDKFRFIFAITLIPGVFWYIITNFLNVSVSYETIQPFGEVKQLLEYSYHHYFGSIQIIERWNPIARFRFNGVFDEPGVVGTIAGLFIVRDYLIKRIDGVDFLLLIEGLLSLSVAFVVLIGMCFVLKNVFYGSLKTILVIFGIIAFYFIFINIPFSNNAISSIQNRLIITSSGLSGSNRTSVLFEQLFQQFNRSRDLLRLLFGYGPDAIETIEGRSCSYKNIIYDYGYATFLLFLTWIAAYTLINGHKGLLNKNSIIFLTIVFANIYQRAGLFYFPYMIIIIGGAEGILGEKIVLFCNTLSEHKIFNIPRGKCICKS